MAKQTFLELTNRVLRRIQQTETTDIAAEDSASYGSIISNLINEGQNALFTETTNWYSLYKSRVFSTVTYTAATIAFNDADPDTITDSAAGMGSFSSASWIRVSGSTSNDGNYRVDTAVAGTLTLQSADELTAEALGESVTLTMITYPVASDFGRTQSLQDITSNRSIVESYDRNLDDCDPNWDTTGIPISFIFQDNAYRLNPIPSSAVKIRDRYWAIPTTLAANTDTSDLPIECENVLIYYAWKEVLMYLGQFEKGDRIERSYRSLLDGAMAANDNMVSKMHIFMSDAGRRGRVGPLLLPQEYGRFR
jgi:hypothetical protein